ncbi:MAG: phosphotransferase [Thermomicrobiales bacterium]
MPHHDDPIRDLIVRTFGPGTDTIAHEAVDSEWAPVERWRLHSDHHEVPHTVVIKTRRANGSGWGYDPRNLVAERRALDLLAPTGLVPHIYAADDALGAIVMEDIAGASTVERMLFGTDPALAHDGLVRLATALGTMHAATTPIDPTPWHPASILMTPLPDAWSTLTQAISHLGLPGFGKAAIEIEDLASSLTDPAWWALTHADANPSNVLVAGDRIALIDFEGANPRHIGIDGGGFALGFPAYRYWADLPEKTIAAMTDAWRTALLPGFPTVADDAVYVPMLATGVLAWTILRLTRLPLIADNGQPPDETHRRRTQIVRTIDLAVATCRTGTTYPAITNWLGTLDDALRQRWPEASNPRHYPAFNGGSREGWIVFHGI